MLSISYPLHFLYYISYILYILQECEYEISQKGELVAKLENKTKEISLMLNNLNKITSPTALDTRTTEPKQSAKLKIPEKKEEKKESKREELENVPKSEPDVKWSRDIVACKSYLLQFFFKTKNWFQSIN